MDASGFRKWLAPGQIILIFGLLLTASSFGHAQQLSVRHYDVRDGLAHSRVNCTHQDAKGYLWFGTSEGLSRFDGYRFTNYGTRDGLGHPFINAITEDRQGRLWVATNGGGVSRLIDDPEESVASGKGRKTFVSSPVGDSPDSNRVNAMLFDSDNTLWCATDAGLYRAAVSPNGDLTFEVIVPREPAMVHGTAFADRHARLWFGILNELIGVAQGQIIKYGPADDAGRYSIVSIVEDHQGRLLLANDRGVFEFIAPTDPRRRGQWKKFPVTLKPGQGIHSMITDSTEALWVGTSNGLIKYKDGKQSLYTTAQGLSDNDIWALEEDRDGNLWIGSFSGGACKLSGELIVSFTKTEGLPDQNVHRVIEDRQGRIYADTRDSGLVEIVEGKAVRIQGSQWTPFNRIYGRILQDRDGDWWIGTDQGLFRFQGPELQLRRGKKFTVVDGIPETSVAGIYEDPGGKVWISLWDRDLYYFDPARAARTHFERISMGQGFFLMISDHSGLWFGAQPLLGRLKNGQAAMLQPTDGLPETDPRAFFIDSREWLWIGLRYKGVSVTKDPTAEPLRFVNYSTENGLASDTVWSIAEDDFGRIYFATGRGLDRLDLTTGRIRHFSTADGLAGGVISHCVKDRQGNIWIATATGLSKFNPRAERVANRPPPIYLSRVQVAGEDRPLAETGARQMPAITLPASQNNLLIEYVGLSFQGERELKYQYKLEGVDADWSPPTDQRSANYARLAPGSYRFAVRAINEEGLSSVEPAVIEFRILPPFWQRWWFVTLIALSIGLMIYAVYRYRVARLIELERVRTRIAADLHDDIGASLSRMAILSEVVKRQVASNVQQSVPLLSDIADSARGLVGSMRDIVWAIDPRRDDLSSVVFRIRQFASDVLEGKGIKWDFHTPSELEKIKLGPDQRRHILLFFKEALNNVARHSDSSTVRLSIDVAHNRLIAEVRDDGRGFVVRPAGQVSTDGHGGHGLENMQRRVAQLGGAFSINSSPGQGTHLKLTIPLKKP